MVTVPHHGAEKFIAGSLAPYDIFLVFGPDAGLVSERVSAILRRFDVNPRDPEQTIRLDGDDLAANPGRLFEETRGLGLFAQKRAVLIRMGGKQIFSSIEAIIEEPAIDCKVVVQAGVLRRESPLRNLIARARNAAAIECYSDAIPDLERIIDATLREAGLSIEGNARNALVGLLGEDRLLTRSELEKLLIYAQGQKHLREADVVNAVANASAFAFDQVIFAAFSGDLATLGDKSGEIPHTDPELSSMLAAMIQHALMLHEILTDVELGDRVETAVEKHKPRSIFGARKEALIRQARVWRRKDIASCIESLSQCSLQTRQENGLAGEIVMSVLLNVARLHNNLRRTKS